MANCFGAVVDNYKLDEMVRYVGKPKRQEDRAREAVNLVNEDSKNDKASRYVQGVKDWYGNGVSTLCLVYNATGGTLRYVADRDWYGYIARTPYPAEIGNGQWAAFLHVHNTGASSGSEGAVVYRGANGNGEERDVLLGWSTPWGPWYSNKAYCKIGGVNSFQSQWDQLYSNVNNAGYNWKDSGDGFEVNANTATGGDPIFSATIKIPFSP